jgi:hypothetical protein
VSRWNTQKRIDFAIPRDSTYEPVGTDRSDRGAQPGPRECAEIGADSVFPLKCVIYETIKKTNWGERVGSGCIRPTGKRAPRAERCFCLETVDKSKGLVTIGTAQGTQIDEPVSQVLVSMFLLLPPGGNNWRDQDSTQTQQGNEQSQFCFHSFLLQVSPSHCYQCARSLQASLLGDSGRLAR